MQGSHKTPLDVSISDTHLDYFRNVKKFRYTDRDSEHRTISHKISQTAVSVKNSAFFVTPKF